MTEQNEIEKLARELFQLPFSESELIDYTFSMVNAGITLHKEHGIENIKRESTIPSVPEASDYMKPEKDQPKVKLPTRRPKDNLPKASFGGFNL